MGLAIFAISVLSECAVVVRSGQSRRALAKNRLATRSVLLLAVVLLMIFSAPSRSSLIYAALLVLLGCLVMVSAINAYRYREADDTYRSGRLLPGLVGTLLLYCLAAMPVVVFPGYDIITPAGAYGVATATHIFVDTERVDIYDPAGGSRQIKAEFWYPTGGEGPFPLVLFSHGSLGIRSSNVSLYTHLASHGYVVGALDHTYQGLYSTDSSGRLILVNKGYLKEVLTEDPRKDMAQSHLYYTKWMAIRMGDIDLIIDEFLDYAGQGPVGELIGLVDATRIGVMGHSLGGSAALGIGRTRPEVRAVAALESPFLYDIVGVEDDKFTYLSEPYPLPLLHIYTDSAWHILGERSQYVANFVLLSSTDQDIHNLHIAGASHFDLTDLALSSPILTRLLNGQRSTREARDTLRAVNDACLAFFDRYLK